MTVTELQGPTQDNPTVLTVWTSGFTGHIASASLRNARLTTLIEMLLRANYSTLQDFSIILSGVVLIQTYKSSTVLSVARKMHQVLSLAKSTRKTSSVTTKSAGPRALGLSLHFSTIVASKAARHNALISSIFGAQSKEDGLENQEYPRSLDFAHQLPGSIWASLLKEDTESDLLSFSKATNVPLSLTNPESQDPFHNSMMGSISLTNHSDPDMQVRAAEGELVRDVSEIELNDLDTSQAAAGHAMHSSLLSKHAFDVSSSTFLEASHRLTNLFLANTSDKLPDVTVIAREIKNSAKKNNAATVVAKRTKPPSFLFDKQARMHHNTMQKYAYKPPNNIVASFLVDFRDRSPVLEAVNTSDITFNWSEPEYRNLATIVSESWKCFRQEELPKEDCIVTTPIGREELLELNYSETLPLNETASAQGDSHSHNQDSIPESGLTLLSMLKQSSGPLSISELAGSSRRMAASLFLASLALRTTNTIVLKQGRTISLQRDVTMSVGRH
ncbi:Hypothetical protein GLP15_355 [Giardia lamblia P15]|uniref:Uncharacterized protein n=1 Tax=Giardia intestinalis (strain P15) TaxID=658858 RepID=E1F536_GIAIA|nr:Hypothetical protein GLP15_355 [Giardia lamblia P15]